MKRFVIFKKKRYRWQILGPRWDWHQGIFGIRSTGRESPDRQDKIMKEKIDGS
jgi:hypothetical protein